MDYYDLAARFLEHPDLQEVLNNHTRGVGDTADGQPCIDPEAVEPLADAIQLFIAYVVSSIIDAGSERDAVMEDDKLSGALVRTLSDW